MSFEDGFGGFLDGFSKTYFPTLERDKERELQQQRQAQQDEQFNRRMGLLEDQQQLQQMHADRTRQANGLLNTGGLLGDLGQHGRSPQELTRKYGFNPAEYVSPQQIAALRAPKKQPTQVVEVWENGKSVKKLINTQTGAEVAPLGGGKPHEGAKPQIIEVDGPQGPGKYEFNPTTKQLSKIGNLTDKGESPFDQEKKIRDTFIKQSTEFIKVRDAYGTVLANSGGSAAGDLGMIFAFMKMLDPGSVVREGEFATASNAAGVDDRLRNQYNRLLNGERLTPEQRQDFLSTANNTYETRLQQHAYLEEQTKGIAEGYGLDPAKIIVDFRLQGRPDTPESNALPDPLGIR